MIEISRNYEHTTLFSPPSSFETIMLSMNICEHIVVCCGHTFVKVLTIDHPCMSLCSCHFREGHLEVVQFLLKDVKLDISIKDGDGITPLHLACL